MKENKLNKIVTCLLYVFTIVTIVLVIYFQKNLTKVAWIIGLGSTVIGPLSIIKKNNYGYIIFSVGFSLLLSAFFYTFKILELGECFTLMICASILLLMVITIIITILGLKKVEKIYDLVIEATVSDLVRNPNTKKEYYQVIYEYVIDDNLYTVGTPDYIDKFIPSIGDKLKIRVSSKDYSEVFFNKRPLTKIYEYGLVIGLIIVTSIIIITLFI